MIKRIGLLLTLVLPITLSSCLAGPQQLRRTVDDFDQKLYVNSPWLDGILWVIPVIPIAGGIAWIGDVIVTNGYTFWFKDAWDGKGTAFKHYQVTPTDGSMKSLMYDDSKWMEVN